jgi:hypothetical protein
MPTSYVNPFTGQTISPSSVGYELLTISANTALSWPINGNPTTSTPVASIIDVTATVAGLTLIMPPATQVSTGQSVLIRNTGAFTVTVVDNSSNTLVSVASGIAQFLFLTDNGTVNGTWASVVFGAGTSTANAMALAGAGLQANGMLLDQTVPVVSYFSNTTLNAATRAQFVVWAGGVGTITLPSAATVGNNWFAIIRNNGAGILTLAPSGTNTIDGNVNQQLQLTESLVIASNGIGGFSTYGYGRSNVFAYTQFAQSVTGGTFTLTAAQALNTIQSYAGALTSNQSIVIPSTVQLYTVTNNTTGAFSFTVKTVAAGGAVVVVPQGTSMVIISDGTNVYNAASGSSSSLTNLTVGNGSLAVPSIKFVGDANTGVYLPSTSNLGVVVANVAVANFTAAGVALPGSVTALGGVSGGTF